MRAFLTSIGEKTTEICKWQLERFGFEVVLLDGVEPWIDKYTRFLNEAREDCIRIDADVIPNKHIKIAQDKEVTKDYYMINFRSYDIYKNDLGATSPIYYSKRGLEVLRGEIDNLNPYRPETSAWRRDSMIEHTKTIEVITGIHGLYQKPEDVERHKKTKEQRRQMAHYDFAFIDKLMEL